MVKTTCFVEWIAELNLIKGFYDTALERLLLLPHLVTIKAIMQDDRFNKSANAAVPI